ncbi:uncharacterized protein ATC70_011567 [Mucor velutinosus]|uniref:G-patch domain-containing protein n=1 Tax=Mucor velutinosus TaxID=708070 RepID=A0AAN7I1I3_9FUNG|nr:hypothetical protein ATC70_011567 [Mucor velutinosus]
MGLAGQKEKQRISQDPNNLFWSKDESKFGFRMLQKMGWAPGKGLGVKEDGKKEHVKIKLKDNTLGVGATKKNIDNWLGNTDAFSRLLADLNSQTASEASSVNASDAEESADTADKEEQDETEEKTKKSKKEKKSKKNKKEKKSKKRSRDDDEGEEDVDSEKKNKKSKKSRKEKKSKDKKKSKKSKKEEAPAPVVLRNAARAKFLRAKRMASSSGDQTRLNEILGIKAPSGYQTVETTSTTFMASFSV